MTEPQTVREPRTEAGRALHGPSGRYHFDSCGVWAVKPCDCGLLAGILAIEQQAALDRSGSAEVLRAAAENVSDTRTLMDDGFWVSRKVMRVLDLALGREDMGVAATPTASPTAGGLAAALAERERIAAGVRDGKFRLTESDIENARRVSDWYHGPDAGERRSVVHDHLVCKVAALVALIEGASAAPGPSSETES